jgi:hypothetical protein
LVTPGLEFDVVYLLVLETCFGEKHGVGFGSDRIGIFSSSSVWVSILGPSVFIL